MSRSWMDSDFGAQPAVMAFDARVLLPPDHSAFEFIEVVRRLDMSAFVAAYRGDGRGRPPFDPRVMLTLILYCRAKGIMSGRGVAAACRDDLGARVITGNRYPDRSTVDRFLGVHRGAIRGVLAQTVRLGHAVGLVDVSVVAGDGTYLLANAAMGATVDEAGLVAQIADLEQQLRVAEAAWLRSVDVGKVAVLPTLFGSDDEDPGGWSSSGDVKARRRVHAVHGKLRARRRALQHLRAYPDTAVTEWQDRLRSDEARVLRCAERLEQTRTAVQTHLDRRQAAEAAGVRIPGTKPVPVDQHIRVRQAEQAVATAAVRAQATASSRPTTTRVNTTDPTSKIMPGKHDGFDQRHNVQALACTNQFIIAITIHPNPNDKQALTPLLRRAQSNLDAAGITDPIGTALFDSGYASEANFTADSPVNLLLIAIEKEARQTGRLRDATSTAAKAWAAMATTLNDPDNRTTYKRRGAIVEPVFAQLFNRFGTAINHRGVNVDTELHLWAATHNILKINRRRRATSVT